MLFKRIEELEIEELICSYNVFKSIKVVNYRIIPYIFRDLYHEWGLISGEVLKWLSREFSIYFLEPFQIDIE